MSANRKSFVMVRELLACFFSDPVIFRPFFKLDFFLRADFAHTTQHFVSHREVKGSVQRAGPERLAKELQGSCLTRLRCEHAIYTSNLARALTSRPTQRMQKENE